MITPRLQAQAPEATRRKAQDGPAHSSVFILARALQIRVHRIWRTAGWQAQVIAIGEKSAIQPARSVGSRSAVISRSGRAARFRLSSPRHLLPYAAWEVKASTQEDYDVFPT